MSHLSDEQDEPFELLGPLDDGAGPARRISRQRASELIQGALAALETPPAPKPRRGVPRKGIWVTGACLVLAGSAAASYWRFRTPPPGPEPVPPMAEVTGRTAMPPPPPVVVPPPEPVVPAETVARPEQVAPSKSKEPVAPGRSSRPRPAPPPAEPEDLMRLANEQRAAGGWREAETLYLRVIQSYPGTASAYVARVASGELRLEHLGDARGALRQFQQALRMQPQGMLSEEALHGVAEAWRALGDTAREAGALEDFLRAHPDSLLAEPAGRRLKDLTSAPQ